MTDTVNPTTAATAIAGTNASSRVPTRWSLSGTRGAGPSDGAWWPQSTNLATELADLDVALHDVLHERIAHATYAKDMWKLGPRKIHTPLGITKIGWFSNARYPENIDLSLTGFSHLVLTVIPPGTEAEFAAIVLGDYGAEPAPDIPTAHYGHLFD